MTVRWLKFMEMNELSWKTFFWHESSHAPPPITIKYKHGIVKQTSSISKHEVTLKYCWVNFVYFNDAIIRTQHIFPLETLSDNDASPTGQYIVITNLCASIQIRSHTHFTVCFWQLPWAPSATNPFIWQKHHAWPRGYLHPHTYTFTYTHSQE